MKEGKLSSKLFKYGVPVLTIVIGVFIARYLLTHRPRSERKPVAKMARLVETVSFSTQEAMVNISAMGTVLPARMVEIKPQVTGKVMEVNESLLPGGFVEKGEVLMRIEPDDYELVVEQRKSDLADALSNLDIELGNQQVARQEFELLGEEISEADEKLVLRKPQLASASAAVKAAESRLEKAELDLERTHIKAPFNAVVNAKLADLGQLVSPTVSVASITGTDEYWIETLVPTDRLKWIDIPGSAAKVYNSSAWSDGHYRAGQVVRLAPSLEESGRMARLIVSVDDPLLLNGRGFDDGVNNVLLLDSYVRVEIEGREVEDVFVVDRELVRDGDNVWIYGPGSKLEIRPVEIVYRGSENVLISGGLSEDDRVVVTDISAPVEGMLLRTVKHNGMGMGSGVDGNVDLPIGKED
jgi:RND family efflux transporter MFP subunit